MEGVLESVTKDKLLQHLQCMLDPKNLALECLYSGNLSEEDAVLWFRGAKTIVFGDPLPSPATPPPHLPNPLPFIQGSSYRVLPPSTDFEIHLQVRAERSERASTQN